MSGQAKDSYAAGKDGNMDPKARDVKLGRNEAESISNDVPPPVIREPDAPGAVKFSWQEIYSQVSPHEALLQALLTSSQSMEEYYEGLLHDAREAGIDAPEVLLSLLWHAPQGDARQHPGRLEYLQKLVMEAQDQDRAAASPEKGSYDLILEQALSMVNKPPDGPAAARPDKSGPSGFHQRPRPLAPQAGAAPRTPLSRRSTRRDSEED